VKESFTAVQPLITDRNARRSVMFIRRQLKEQTRDWQARINDPKTDPREADFMRGELHSAMMWFNVIENARSLHARLEQQGEEKFFDALVEERQQRPIQVGR
jgi:hypothetical protein